METTRLSTKGQVIIPKSLRDANQWQTGQELSVIDTGDGLLLRPKAPFERTRVEDVAGILSKGVPSHTDAQVKSALRNSMRKKWRGRD